MEVKRKALLLFFNFLSLSVVKTSEPAKLYAEKEVVALLQAAQYRIEMQENHIAKQDEVIAQLTQMLCRKYELEIQVEVGTGGSEMDLR